MRKETDLDAANVSSRSRRDGSPVLDGNTVVSENVDDTSVPTRVDLSVQVRIFFKNPFSYEFFQKYRFLHFCTDFFFLRDHFYKFYS